MVFRSCYDLVIYFGMNFYSMYAKNILVSLVAAQYMFEIAISSIIFAYSLTLYSISALC